MLAKDPNSITNTTVIRKPRRHKIPAVSKEAWNKVIYHIEKNRVSIVGSNPTFLHPWKIIFARLPEKTAVEGKTLRVNPLNYSKKTIKAIKEEKDEDLRWHFQFMPGFVNGTPVRLRTKACSASDNSRLRVYLERKAAGMSEEDAKVKDDMVIDVPLTEFPFIALEDFDDVRTVGFTGNIMNEEFEFGQGPELVPEPFLAIGCKNITTTTKITTSGIVSDENGQKDIKEEDVRLLRAADVIVKVERASLKYDIEKGNPYLDGYSQIITPRYGRNSAKNKYADIRIQAAKWIPVPTPTMDELMSGLPTDPEYDEVRIATIYFIAPFGTGYGSQEENPITGEWQIEVKYHTFWNLSYCPAEIPSRVPPEPLRLITPLLAGITNSIINTILSGLNDAMSRYMASMRAKPLKGIFWST